jgi:hypothetical protein
MLTQRTGIPFVLRRNLCALSCLPSFSLWRCRLWPKPRRFPIRDSGTLMPALNEITLQQPSRLIGLPGAPRLIDVRTAEDHHLDPRVLPGARHMDLPNIANWGPNCTGEAVVVYCRDGSADSRGLQRGCAQKGSMPKPWREVRGFGVGQASLSCALKRCPRATPLAAPFG